MLVITPLVIVAVAVAVTPTPTPITLGADTVSYTHLTLPTNREV